MSSKIGLILSMIFVAMFFLLGVDLICIQYTYSELDAKSITISYLISHNGGLNSDFISALEATYNIDFQCLENCTPSFGDVVKFSISTEYSPFILSPEPMTLKVSRTTTIGFYG